ncbi:GlsB/YeaQ/YmgE family stress response membrane protein [Brooklawnia sp.]|uniref:GlsB/YeaQ/YmgE family stress response membrane protein n=1 Tax=Propionibacteriales TaxID=85009 RepID=UPI00311D818B
MLSWGFLGWIILGGIAGWIASKIMKTDASMGILMNIIVGIVGGLLGGWILSAFNVNVAGGGLIFSMLTAIGGAVLLLWLIGLVSGRRRA